MQFLLWQVLVLKTKRKQYKETEKRYSVVVVLEYQKKILSHNVWREIWRKGELWMYGLYRNWWTLQTKEIASVKNPWCVIVLVKSEEHQGDIFSSWGTSLWMRSFKSQFPSCLNEKTETQNILLTSVDKWSILHYESNFM